MGGQTVALCGEYLFLSFQIERKLSPERFLGLHTKVCTMVSCRVRSDPQSGYNELDKREKLETGTATAINYNTL